MAMAARVLKVMSSVNTSLELTFCLTFLNYIYEILQLFILIESILCYIF